MKRAGQSVEGFDKRMQKMAINAAKAGTAIAVALTAAAGAALKMGREAAAVGVEIRNLADISGIGTTDFQKYAAASKSVGIEQQKLADIFKDVNDKFGDYMATGAGPLADFFEQIAPQIGVTADQFARLSGPEALQLYVSSLDQAGVSQQQMTFYMEALASDATALVPLLRDNGAAMRELGRAAEDAGRILDEDAIAAAAELDQVMNDLTDTLRINATEAVLEHKDELILLVDFITETLIPAVSGLVGALGTAALGWKTIAQEARDAIMPMARALGLAQELPQSKPEPGYLYGETPVPTDDTGAGSQGDPSSTGLFYVDENGNVQSYGEDTPETPGITAPERVYSGRGNAAGPTPDEALQAYIEARREGLAEVETVEEEHASKVRQIRNQSAEDLAAIEAAAKSQRLNDMRSMFGDLSSLMQSENKKIFKIGQAAALAETIISGAYSAQKAYEGGLRSSGGQPAVGALYAAASLAATATQIAAIKSASSSGGSSGGGGGSSAGTTQQAQPQEQQPGTTFRIAIQNDPMGFGESFARQLIDQLNATQRNGGQVRGVIV